MKLSDILQSVQIPEDASGVNLLTVAHFMLLGVRLLHFCYGRV